MLCFLEHTKGLYTYQGLNMNYLHGGATSQPLSHMLMKQLINQLSLLLKIQ